MDHLLYLAEKLQEILSNTFMEFTVCNFLNKVSEVSAAHHVVGELRVIPSSFSNCSDHPLSMLWEPTLESQLEKVPANLPVTLVQPLWTVERGKPGKGPGSQSEPSNKRRTCWFRESGKHARGKKEEPNLGHMLMWLSLSQKEERHPKGRAETSGGGQSYNEDLGPACLQSHRVALASQVPSSLGVLVHSSC